jgi:heme o synthase
VFRSMNMLLELTKCRISIFASLSVLAGFILAKHEVSKEIILPVIGVFFLACGSCAFNQYQERTIDGLMERTKRRPLPSGRLDPRAGLWTSLGLTLLGALILFHGVSRTAGGLGLFAMVWYNGVYTYLKRKSAFAAIPGALVGAIPPTLGWVSGGGSLFDRQIWAIAFFVFIWQVPHFWLLLLEYSMDYAKTGLPSLTRTFAPEQLKRIVFVWILATAASSLLIPLFYSVKFFFTYVFLLLATFWLVWTAVTFFRNHFSKITLTISFVRLNLFALFVMGLLSLDKLLNSNHADLNLISKLLAMVGFKPV